MMIISSQGFHKSERIFQHSLFARLVELDRLRRNTAKLERKESANLGKKDLDRTVKLPSESKEGVKEIYTQVIWIICIHKFFFTDLIICV